MLDDIQPLVDSCLEAWNNRDLDAIMSHHSDDVEMKGPTIVGRRNREDGYLVSWDEVQMHFREASS